MKAHWVAKDWQEMSARLLRFAGEDVDLIHRGFAGRGEAGLLGTR